MHEWALAEAIISAASEIAEKEEIKKITGITVGIGELQTIEKDILKFALSQLKTARFKEAKFELKTEKARLKCRACGTSWAFNRKNVETSELEAIHFIPEIAHTYIKCPKCGSPDFEILKGRGITLQTVKGVK
jgi:hydrogenase nickel incorporation protein HypA/HybF